MSPKSMSVRHPGLIPARQFFAAAPSNYGCTTCVTTAELLAMFEFPLYITLTEFEPAGRDDVANVPLPPLN